MGKAVRKKRRVEDGIWQLEDGRWHVDIRPDGRNGPRFRKTVTSKTDAKQVKLSVLSKASRNEEWRSAALDNRKLSALIDEWYTLYGYTLKDGENRCSKLEAIIARLGNPVARAFSAQDWMLYRSQRLKDKRNGGKTITPNTVNHEHAYLSAMFGTLIKLQVWTLNNPMRGLPKLKIDEPELIYLELDQIEALLNALGQLKNTHALVVTKICLATGARWGEAERLTRSQFKAGKIHFVKTKSSKARAIPICSKLEREILDSRPELGRLFSGDLYHYFRVAIKIADINLPDGQLTHVLRHTFASHFMIQDGNILKLKDILGHSTLTMTLRYAKLAPAHLAQALTHNPLAKLASTNRPH